MIEIPTGAQYSHPLYPDMFYKVEGRQLLVWNGVLKRWNLSWISVEKAKAGALVPIYL